ncbi:YnhF family membrane protein [Vibrio galatheae]
MEHNLKHALVITVIVFTVLLAFGITAIATT